MRNWMDILDDTFQVPSMGLAYFKSINIPILFSVMNNAGLV